MTFLVSEFFVTKVVTKVVTKEGLSLWEGLCGKDSADFVASYKIATVFQLPGCFKSQLSNVVYLL